MQSIVFPGTAMRDHFQIARQRGAKIGSHLLPFTERNIGGAFSLPGAFPWSPSRARAGKMAWHLNNSFISPKIEFPAIRMQASIERGSIGGKGDPKKAEKAVVRAWAEADFEDREGGIWRSRIQFRWVRVDARGFIALQTSETA